jgi:hypothetical protein
MVLALAAVLYLCIEMISGCTRTVSICTNCCERGEVGVECKSAKIVDLLRQSKRTENKDSLVLFM